MPRLPETELTGDDEEMGHGNRVRLLPEEEAAPRASEEESAWRGAQSE